ncbi:type II toxin-antitoxin system VapC family toxin [Candidatus Pacearchaeota archaeon]|nr:type II toxin-antitoxin system VapC family toxin [Candidatus Pacearchaeota archaeon]
MEQQERHLQVTRDKAGKISTYENHEKNDFITEDEIIGFDANVFVDLVCSSEFKEEVRAQVLFNVLKIYTTNIALGEARNVLVKKKGYTKEKATEELKSVLKEFSIEYFSHNNESNDLGNKWLNEVKSKMHIKKFSTFQNDCKILSNLYNQKAINVFFTEDKDIEKAVRLLKLRIRVKIVAEASNVTNSKVKNFFKKPKYKK